MLRLSFTTVALVLILTLSPPVALAAGGQALYLVKVVISSDSDWTSINLLSDERIVNARYTVVRGNVSALDIAWTPRWFGVSRCCYPEHVIDATVEFHLLIADLGESRNVIMQIQKGNVGSTDVKIYNRYGELVKHITHSGVVPESGGRNPLNFTLPADSIVVGEVYRLGESSYNRLVWAAYYPWYVKESWRDKKMADRPLIGEYSSDSEEVIRLHVRMAKALGIDGFAVSWWGPDTNTDKNLKKILEIAKDEGLYVTAYLESLGGEGEARPLTELENMFRYLITTYGNHPAYYKLYGKPVIFVWAAWSHTPEEWGSIFESLREKGLEALYIATASNTQYLDYFDGLQNYATGNLTELRKLYEKIGPAVKTYHILYGGSERLWVPAISPGYDERLLPGRRGLFYEREEGIYYLESYGSALASYPDWIWITSFNEWWENTHIEPSEKYGYRYLFLTERITADFKNKPSNPDKIVRIILEIENTVTTVTKPTTVTETSTVTRYLEGGAKTIYKTVASTSTVTETETSVVVSTFTVERGILRTDLMLFAVLPLALVAAAALMYAVRVRRRTVMW